MKVTNVAEGGVDLTYEIYNSIFSPNNSLFFTKNLVPTGIHWDPVHGVWVVVMLVLDGRPSVEIRL